jgi:hypothetical protein
MDQSLVTDIILTAVASGSPSRNVLTMKESMEEESTLELGKFA